eukprot:12883142-Prorocentrum_lima.AAC.1
MNIFESDELNAQRGVVDGLMHHMEQHVGSLGTYCQEEAVKLRFCEAESEEHLAKAKRYRQIVPDRLQLESLHASELCSELQARGQT